MPENDPNTTPGEALAPTPGTSLDRPSFIPVGDTSGTENIGAADIQMPRLSLAQALSPQIDESHAKYIKGLRAGDLFNDISQKIYGRGPLDFIVIRVDRPRYIEFHPRNEGGGIKDMNVPLGDPRTEFVDGKPPVATMFRDFVILLLPDRELIALSFKSTSLKVGKLLNSHITERNAPVYAGRYILGAVPDKNPKGSFFNFKVVNNGFIRDEEEYKYAAGLFNALKDRTIHIEREPGSDDTSFDTSQM